MKFLIVVMIARLIIKAVDKKSAKEKMTVERNEVRDPAAFRVR
jgi:hypothetical protein